MNDKITLELTVPELAVLFAALGNNTPKSIGEFIHYYCPELDETTRHVATGMYLRLEAEIKKLGYDFSD